MGRGLTGGPAQASHMGGGAPVGRGLAAGQSRGLPHGRRLALPTRGGDSRPLGGRSQGLRPARLLQGLEPWPQDSLWGSKDSFPSVGISEGETTLLTSFFCIRLGVLVLILGSILPEVLGALWQRIWGQSGPDFGSTLAALWQHFWRGIGQAFGRLLERSNQVLKEELGGLFSQQLETLHFH